MRSDRMRRRAVWPIVVAGLLPALAAFPGLYLGVLQVLDALRNPPATGLVSLGMVLGFWLGVGSLFLACATLLLVGIALDVRDLRNRSVRNSRE